MSTASLPSSGGEMAFHRGIHPPHRKYTEAEQIQLFIPKDNLTIPMAQHIGAPCEPTVKTRDEVKLGDKVADTQAFVSAPIHSPINGVIGPAGVTAIPGGRRVPSITIKLPAEGEAIPADFLQTFLDRNWDGVEPTSYDPEQICTGIREAGIVGLGGATFPTFIKLKRDPNRLVDTILLNGTECEPYLTNDHRLMVECPEAIVVGLQIAMHAAGAQRGLICIENNKPDAIAVMRKIAADRPGIEVAVCAAKYPMGGERQLIPAVTGRTVPSAPTGLPLDVGVVVVNVATAHAIARAIVRNQPLTHRVVSIAGKGITKPSNLLVPIGTSFVELFAACGGTTPDALKVLAGGPMMGPCVPNLNVPVVKGTGGITVMTAAETTEQEERSCIRCGRCVENCPLHLMPTKLYQAIKHRDYEGASYYDLMACCECGCCGYVCPAQIPLPQYIRSGKNQWRVILQQKKEQEKLEQEAKKD